MDLLTSTSAEALAQSSEISSYGSLTLYVKNLGGGSAERKRNQHQIKSYPAF